jgi:hypothetical protein
VHEVECQTQILCQDASVGEVLQTADAEAQYERDTRDVGIQPSVSAFKLEEAQKELADELVNFVIFFINNKVNVYSKDIMFMADIGVQFEDPKTYRSVGIQPQLSTIGKKVTVCMNN